MKISREIYIYKQFYNTLRPFILANAKIANKSIDKLSKKGLQVCQLCLCSSFRLYIASALPALADFVYHFSAWA